MWRAHLHLDPLLVGECGPHVVRLHYHAAVRAQQHARLLTVDVQRAQDEDEPRERRVHRHARHPIIVKIKHAHLHTCGGVGVCEVFQFCHIDERPGELLVRAP